MVLNGTEVLSMSNVLKRFVKGDRKNPNCFYGCAGWKNGKCIFGSCRVLKGEKCRYFESHVLPPESYRFYPDQKILRKIRNEYFENIGRPHKFRDRPIRMCPDCGKNELPKRRRYCDKCRDRRRKLTQKNKNAKRRRALHS